MFQSSSSVSSTFMSWAPSSSSKIRSPSMFVSSGEGSSRSSSSSNSPLFTTSTTHILVLSTKLLMRTFSVPLTPRPVLKPGRISSVLTSLPTSNEAKAWSSLPKSLNRGRGASGKAGIIVVVKRAILIKYGTCNAGVPLTQMTAMSSSTSLAASAKAA